MSDALKRIEEKYGAGKPLLRPTIEELEKILNSENPPPVQILPNGELVTGIHPVVKLARALDGLWLKALNLASKLESQVIRDPSLPQGYKQILSEGFDSIRKAERTLEEVAGEAGPVRN